MTNMKNVLKLSEQELRSGMKTSWHDQYRHSAWIFVGGLPYDLTEGDIICVFSQYGEVVNINLVRDKGTGKSKGFCFLCYEDQRSTNLAVDNFNGIKLLNRTIRVDHCENYKAPKDDKMDEDTQQLHAEGCAPGSKFGKIPQLPNSTGSNGGLDKGLNLPPMESLLKIKTEKEDHPPKQMEKSKKEKKSQKPKDEIRKLFKKKKKEKQSSSSSSDDSSSDSEDDRPAKKKSANKSKRKNQGKSSSSSEEGEKDHKMKRQRKSSRKSCSSESDSEDGRTAKKRDRSGGKEFDGQKVHHVKQGADGRTKDDVSRHHDGNRVNVKDSSYSHRAFREFDKNRGDGSQRLVHDRTSRSKDESGRYRNDKTNRTERGDNREGKAAGDWHREHSREDGDRRRRDEHWEHERHRRSDGGVRR